MHMQRGRRSALVGDLALMALAGLFFGYGWYDLFISIPGEHTPRIRVEEGSWGVTKVWFHLDTPTLSSFVILLTSACALWCSVRILVNQVRSSTQSMKASWVGLLVCLALSFMAYLCASLHFFGTAFRGVG